MDLQCILVDRSTEGCVWPLGTLPEDHKIQDKGLGTSRFGKPSCLGIQYSMCIQVCNLEVYPRSSGNMSKLGNPQQLGTPNSDHKVMVRKGHHSAELGLALKKFKVRLENFTHQEALNNWK